MITTFGTITQLSFYCWLDNYILNKGQAYLNVTTPFFYQADPSLNPAYVAYAAPFRSFVWDSGVAGATILQSISGSIGTGSLSHGQSGMMFDFFGGRVILPSSFGTTQVISGSYACKELNVYKSNETQEQLVFTNKYYLNSRFARPLSGVSSPGSYVTPAIFVTKGKGKNEQFAFGGLYETKPMVHMVVMAENLSQLEGTLSMMEDAKDSYFPQLNTNVWPLNAYGDWKSGYNYNTIQSQYGQPSNLFYISDVQTSKVSDGVKIDENIFVGLVDIELSRVRTIR